MRRARTMPVGPGRRASENTREILGKHCADSEPGGVAVSTGSLPRIQRILTASVLVVPVIGRQAMYCPARPWLKRYLS